MYSLPLAFLLLGTLFLSSCSEDLTSCIKAAVSGTVYVDASDDADACGKARSPATLQAFNRSWKQYLQQADQFLITTGGGFCASSGNWSIERSGNQSTLIGKFGLSGRYKKFSRELTIEESQQVESTFAAVRPSRVPNLKCSYVSDGCGDGLQIVGSQTRTFYPENQLNWALGDGYILNQSFADILKLVKILMPEDICNRETCEDVEY